MTRKFDSGRRRAANDNNGGHDGAGIFILDIDLLTEAGFGIDPNELSRWLDRMGLGTRLLTGAYDRRIEAWTEFGFLPVRRRRDQSLARSGCALAATEFRRVFLATAPSELSDWCSSAKGSQILVGCVPEPTHSIPTDVRRRLVAIYYMRRFLFPLPPAIECAA